MEIQKVIPEVESRLTVSQQARSNLPSHLQKISESLAPAEQDILAVKYRSPRIANLPAEDVPKHAKGLLFRIHTITGWKLPDDDLFLNTLVSEFTNYLGESCADLNPEEISYAIRNYGIGIQDWGKSMNLSLINDPIQKYRQMRIEVSERERMSKDAFLLASPSPKNDTPVDWSEEWNQVKEAAKNRKIETSIIPVAIYEWLVRKNMLSLSSEDKWELFNQAHASMIQKLQIDISEGKADMNDIQKLKFLQQPDWKIRDDLYIPVINAAKVMAVKQLAMSESLDM